MTAHIFENSLDYEQSQFVEQDKFYKEQLNAATIKRFDFNDPEEKEFQKEDIDLQLTFDDGRDSIYVSEKHELDCAQSYTVVYLLPLVRDDAVFTVSRETDGLFLIRFYFFTRKHGDSRIN